MNEADPKSRRNRPALALHVPEPALRPGDTPDFSSVTIPAAGEAPRPDVAGDSGRNPPADQSPRPRARRGRQGGRPVGSQARPRHAARDAPRHDDGARFRRPDVPRPAAGQDQLLHEVHRRGGDRGRRRRTRSTATTCASRPIASRACWSRAAIRCRDDVPDLFEQGRQAEGPPAADHVFGQGARLLLDLAAISAPNIRRRSAGRWPSRDQGRQPHRHGLDRRRRDRRGRLPRRVDLRRGLPRAGHPRRRQQPVGDLELLGDRRRRARDLRRARRRLWHRGPARRRQ